MIQKLICTLLLLVASTFSYGQTTDLEPGDLAITGFNTEDVSSGLGDFTTVENEFTFVLLTDIEANTVIRFTDNGWTSGDTFRSGEGTIIWESDIAMTCGTPITITTGTIWWGIVPFEIASEGSIDNSDFLSFELGTNGDQILVYQGDEDLQVDEDDPSFIFGINFNGNNWSSTANNTQNSALPDVLTNNTNALSLKESDGTNATYNCDVIVGTDLILDAITLPSRKNWIQSTDRITLNICEFACEACDGTVTWNGTTWSNGTGPTEDNAVIIDGNYNTSSGNFKACSLIINATVTVSDNSFIEVNNEVIVNGTLDVERRGNFVQRGEGTDAGTFTGTATLSKTTPSKAAYYYFTYWSSPVTGATIDGIFPDVGADRRLSFDATKFIDNDGDDVDDNGDDWVIVAGSDTMTPGVGYAVTAVKTGFTAGTETITFTGTFNTGDITVPIEHHDTNTGTKWNFIGNPYPSAIDFELFADANSTVVEGVAYFWSQDSAPLESNPGNGKLNFNQADYAVYNYSGGVGTEPTRPGGDIDMEPNGFVPSGQGFFIPAKTRGTATFTNTMRMANGTSNRQFFKTAGTKKSTATNTVANKLWINLTSNNGVFNQTLIAYVDGATNGKDAMAYDAPKVLNPGFAAALYTNIINDGGKYTIQGKAINSLNEDEVIQLGFSTTIEVATEYKLSIDHLQGEFLNSNTIYIKDNALNTIHSLTDSDYGFTSEVGEFNERFEIIFKEEAALSLDENNLEENILSIVQLSDDDVRLKTSDNLTIKTVAVFDLLGRQLYDLKGTKSTETYRLTNLSKAAYVVKVQLSNGAVITKKIIKN